MIFILIHINKTNFQADGGNYCACVNAATLALIDAGIPLKDYVTACTASMMLDTPLVDISNLEATTGKKKFMIFTQKDY